MGPGCRIFLVEAPDHYWQLFDRRPADVTVLTRMTEDADIVHLFATTKTELKKTLSVVRHKMRQNGTVWVSWPKKTSKVATDVTEDVVRAVALPLGLVDVKVCAVDEIWSGLKLVIRKENRKPIRSSSPI